MYKKHFSFKHKPFDLVPNPDFLFLSSTHQKAITHLDYGLREEFGFILLTGEIGSGKTTLIRNLIKNLNGSFHLSKINNTKVSSEQLIAMINEDFGLDSIGKNKTRLLSELNEFLIDQYAKKIKPLLLIDEAQNLTPELLEEVRLLSNLETDRTKLIQIILVGQPELKSTLMLPELLQLRQRINISYHISPLSFAETAAYIRHRLAVAGNPAAMSVNNNMQDIVYQFSRGIPRLINILCDFALLGAFAEGKNEVTDDIVKEVAKDLEAGSSGETPPARNSKQDSDDLLKTTGDVALRLIRLEETVKNNISGLAALSDKISRLENHIAEAVNLSEKRIMTDLIDRLKGLAETDIKPHEENGNSRTKKLRHLEGQIDSVTKIIGFLNEKLKGL